MKKTRSNGRVDGGVKRKRTDLDALNNVGGLIKKVSKRQSNEDLEEEKLLELYEKSGIQSGNIAVMNYKFSNDNNINEDDSSSDEKTRSVNSIDREVRTSISMETGKRKPTSSDFLQGTVNDRTDNELNYSNNGRLINAGGNETQCNVKSDNNLETKYMQHCHRNGFMDSEEHFRDEIKKITRKYGWKYFKVLSDSDYHYSSPFAECMLDHFGYEKLAKSEKESTWEKVKRDVFQAMQIARSGATQGLKRVFLCE
jgi:hypothetical protein